MYTPGGYSILFHTGVRVAIWGLRFYKKLIFEACDYSLRTIQCFAQRIEKKLRKKPSSRALMLVIVE